jgi:hypothetical protein
MLNGQNFCLRVEGEVCRMGFYTTRFVQADNEREAELAAVNLIGDDPQLQVVINDGSDPPTIYTDEIAEVAAPDPECPNGGYTFYFKRKAMLSGRFVRRQGRRLVNCGREGEGADRCD